MSMRLSMKDITVGEVNNMMGPITPESDEFQKNFAVQNAWRHAGILLSSMGLEEERSIEISETEFWDKMVLWFLVMPIVVQMKENEPGREREKKLNDLEKLVQEKSEEIGIAEKSKRYQREYEEICDQEKEDD
jgi:hypothetical protein